MKDRALVLGGGGPVGVAWETGVAAGLAAEGILLGKADFVLGTSAGSFVGAQLARGRDPQSLAEAQIELGRQAASGASGVPAAAPDLTPLMGFIARFPRDDEPSQELLAEVGKFARESATMPEDQFTPRFSVLSADGGEWPERYACTAVDAENGAFKIWRKGDAVPLVSAVASSCAVPGIRPTISIQGRKWMDGGMRSATNIDCAAGYKRVLVLAVVPGEAAAAFMGPRIARERAVVERAGGRVEIVTPDTAAAETFGINLMNESNRAEVTNAGIAQGRREAERLRTFWE
jgi:NTE family protein